MRRRAGQPVPLEVSILRVFTTDERRQIHGFALAERLADAGGRALTAHGTLYRALGRMEAAGWLESEWEDGSVAARDGRPPRRLYSVTAAGRTVLASQPDTAIASGGAGDRCQDVDEGWIPS